MSEEPKVSEIQCSEPWNEGCTKSVVRVEEPPNALEVGAKVIAWIWHPGDTDWTWADSFETVSIDGELYSKSERTGVVSKIDPESKRPMRAVQ